MINSNRLRLRSFRRDRVRQDGGRCAYHWHDSSSAWFRNTERPKPCAPGGRPAARTTKRHLRVPIVSPRTPRTPNAADATAARFAAPVSRRVNFAEAAIVARMAGNKSYAAHHRAKIIPSAPPRANIAFYAVAATLSAWCGVLAAPVRSGLAGTE